MATAPSVDFVRLELSDVKRIKLRFKHAQLRKAVVESGRSIGELATDPFGGWPYLLAEGHRPFDPKVTIDVASGWIDEWVETKDPKTGADRDLAGLMTLLSDALIASGFLSTKPEIADTDGEAEEKAGNE
jgi:hypothetical protein